MKIALIITSLKNCGPVNVVHTLVNYLNYHHKITVFYLKDVESDVVSFPCDVKKISLFDTIDWSDFDVVHSHGIKPDLFVAMHNRQKQIATLSTVHSSLWEDLPYRYGKIKGKLIEYVWKKILKRFDKIAMLSNYAAQHYRKTSLFKKIVVCPNGVDNHLEQRAGESHIEPYLSWITEKKQQGFKVVGSISMLDKCKGLEQVIKAIDDMPHVVYVILGSGPEEADLKELVHQMNLQDRCLFTGFQTDIASFMDLFDIYIIASYTEGVPMTLLEAMMHAKPCICSNIPTLKEHFSNYVELFEVDNKASLIDTINKVLNNLKALGDISHQAWQKNFSGEKMAKSYLDIYQEIQE